MCTMRGGAQVEPLAGILPDIFVFSVLSGIFFAQLVSALLGSAWPCVEGFSPLLWNQEVFLTQSEHILRYALSPSCSLVFPPLSPFLPQLQCSELNCCAVVVGGPSPICQELIFTSSD